MAVPHRRQRQRAAIRKFKDALHELRAPSDLELIRSAAAKFSDETEAALYELDNKFYQYPDDLTELLYKYVSAHPEEFGELPDPAAS